MLPIDPRASTRIEDFITSLNRDELIYMQRLVVDRLKAIGRADDAASLRRLSPGDTVLFSHAGQGIRGRVVKCHRTTVTVQAADGRLWKVTARLLHQVD